MICMSARSNRSLLLAVVFLAAACGKDDQNAQKSVSRSEIEGDRKPKNAKRKTPHAEQVEAVLAIEATLEKLAKEIKAAEDAGDFDTLAELRPKHQAAQLALEEAKERLRLMDFMREKKRQEDLQKAKQTADAGVP